MIAQKRCVRCGETKNGNAMMRESSVCRRCEAIPDTSGAQLPASLGPAYMPGLRALRQELGLSVRELAHRAGVTPRMVVYLECGRSRASETTQRRILEAVVHARREQREMEEERMERIARSGVGA